MIFRKALTLASILALLLVAVQAHAAEGDWMIGFSAGAATPRGDYRRGTEDGFIGGGELDYLVTEKLALGIDGFLTSNNRSDLVEENYTVEAGTPVTITVAMLQGGAHLKYLFSRAVVSPFLLVGLGAYHVKNSFQSANPYVNAMGRGGQMRFGTRAGLGMMCKANKRITIGVEGAYHTVWTEYADAQYLYLPIDSDQFISVRAGVSMITGSPED